MVLVSQTISPLHACMMIFSLSRRPSLVVLAIFCLLVTVQICVIRGTLLSSTLRSLSILQNSASIETVADFTAAHHKTALPSFSEEGAVFPEGGGGSRIRQCTSIWPGEDRPQFERALNTHIQYGAKWGYPTDILRHFLVESKEHNKVAYILYLVLGEMAKPQGTRAEWILSVLFPLSPLPMELDKLCNFPFAWQISNPTYLAGSTLTPSSWTHLFPWKPSFRQPTLATSIFSLPRTKMALTPASSLFAYTNRPSTC